MVCKCRPGRVRAPARTKTRERAIQRADDDTRAHKTYTMGHDVPSIHTGYRCYGHQRAACHRNNPGPAGPADYAPTAIHYPATTR